MRRAKLWLSFEDRDRLEKLGALAELESSMVLCDDKEAAEFSFALNGEIWELSFLGEAQWRPLSVDFLSEDWKFRAKRTWNSKELLRDALGVRKGEKLRVVDGTAGLGADSFMMALWGHHVVAYEQHPLLALMLKQAVEKASSYYQDFDGFGALDVRASRYEDGDWGNEVDVLYLDPIYPEKKKAALNRKELRIVKGLVGAAELSDQSLSLEIKEALPRVQKRIVVKRPVWSPRLPWEGGSPRMIEGKSTRFELFDRALVP